MISAVCESNVQARNGFVHGDVSEIKGSLANVSKIISKVTARKNVYLGRDYVDIISLSLSIDYSTLKVNGIMRDKIGKLINSHSLG